SNVYRQLRLHRDADLSSRGLIPKLRRQGGWEPSLLHRDGSPGRGGHARWRSGEIIEEITGTGGAQEGAGFSFKVRRGARYLDFSNLAMLLDSRARHLGLPARD